ncbi:MAG TPA: hypothetical protein VN665_02740, partial [Candidatus Paceibacterota bacterium]|nr:hypothetical protein [Candidatus Paceibacterota bacterium]
EGRKVESHDRAIRELVYMHKMAALYPALRGKIVAGMERLATRRPLSDNMRKYVAGALKAAGSVVYYGWLAGQETVVSQSRADLISPKKYDGELHGLITEAMEGSVAWSYVTLRLVKASEDGQLRPGVRSRFLLQCTDSAETDKVAKLPFVEGVKQTASTSPLGSKTKKVDKAALQARRAARNADRPVGRHESAPDPHGKGKNKSNKKK